MGDTWYLKLMGFPELRRPDGRPVKLKVRKHLALLVYLVLDERERYPRDQLADFLWPEAPDGNSRHSLSMAFSVLRGLFGADSIRGNHVEVEFRRPGLILDLDRLERGEVLGSETEQPLEVDRFLRGFDIEDAPAFQHWCDRRNAQLLPLLQAGILTLVDQARRSGNLQRMMALADRLLALDSLAEEGIRARMEAFAMQGDRVSALRVFEDWKRQLTEELGAVPSEILEGLAARLRRRAAEPVAAAGGHVLAIEPWAERFIGREAEFQVLFEAWEATTQLNTRHVLLSGDTGIGKSTLAMRFAASAALEGAAVARVQCFELEQRIAFGMIGALVTSLLDRPAVAGTTPESLAEVARMVPKVRERFPHLPAPRPTEGEAARLHFAEGTFALFDAIMEEQPLILIVDDYPRSDEASLSVLHMLLRRAGSDRLMIVLSGRPPEPDEPPQATRIRKGIAYLPLRKLDLAPFTEAESEALLHALLARSGKAPGSPERRALLRTAGGNPMALELLTQDWLTHGEAALAVSLPAMRADVPGSALEAIGYDRLIERMLPTLTPRTRMALFLAAILGPRLNDLDCFGVVDLKPPQTIAALSELVESRVLRNSGGGLEFINELIRARLYLKIPSSARVRLHHGVADRLLSAVASGEKAPNLEVAWHCIRAHRREEATPFLMNGARDAITHGAPDEAARALSSALGHLRGRAKAEATLLLAETYQEMAQWKDALECLGELERAQLEDPGLRELAEVLRLESRHQLEASSPNSLDALFDDMVLRVLTSKNPTARVRAALLASQIAASLRKDDLMIAVTKAASNIPMHDLSKRDSARVLLSKAMAHYHLRDLHAAFEEAHKAARIVDDMGATDTTFVRIQVGLGVLACISGDYARSTAPLERAFSAAARLDHSPLMAQAGHNLALAYYRLGQKEEHLKWSVIARQRAVTTSPGSSERVHSVAYCALAYFDRGEREKLARALEDLRIERTKSNVSWVLQSALVFEADLAWLCGNKRLALEKVRELRMAIQDKPAKGMQGRLARWEVVSAIASSRLVEARTVIREWYADLAQLDALDQAEVLCGLAYLSNLRNSGSNAFVDQARIALARLPLACSKQLQRLGLPLPH
jgi:DNA-binding SARP family transcriptional activator